MKTVFLERFDTGDQGTLGNFVTDGFSCKTIELPWLDNMENISCVPAGIYTVVLRKSPRFGWVYWLKDCIREYILTHWGNLAGNMDSGFKTHSLGCILQGKWHGTLNGQKAVLLSRPTVNAFIDFMKGADFKLDIRWGFPI